MGNLHLQNKIKNISNLNKENILKNIELNKLINSIGVNVKIKTETKYPKIIIANDN
jgi:DNA gyrase/topoisomerase IV subunit B